MSQSWNDATGFYTNVAPNSTEVEQQSNHSGGRKHKRPRTDLNKSLRAGFGLLVCVGALALLGNQLLDIVLSFPLFK